MGASLGTFLAMVINIWARHDGKAILNGFIEAFILTVTIVVVAIPEGLPLAVTISLAYSTKKMYADQCFIRVLAACETMGNATCICSDKTGTLTQNRMTVVEGWFGNQRVNQQTFKPEAFSAAVKKMVAEHVCLNRTAYFVWKDSNGKQLDRPNIIGNKTEGALLMMAKNWGYEYEAVGQMMFSEERDKIYSFNSGKKRSTAVVHLPDGTVRVYCKGATEWVLRDCAYYLDQQGLSQPMTGEMIAQLEGHISDMADLALRTLLLAHRDFASVNDLPPDWVDNPPDSEGLTVDCIVGIIDPLRDDVIAAVATAQRAGVVVRMVTGDNVATAKAIARQCGILTNGTAIEGPVFRKLSPAEADLVLPKIQVMARSSPDDKYLMVTRLNGHGVPDGKEEWEEKMKLRGTLGVSWDTHRDLLLPGYREEWEASRPAGGHVVGVTGDGTNDAPALKAADVGLAMGITGTKVAQGASDIVILDDRFSSIVKAILWGRSVYDNIRKFLQFQLTVNIVALLIVFIGAVAGFTPPLNAVQMLWVNLVMDSFGALALGTEAPNQKLLDRKPYKRDASLVSRVMWRNILSQSFWQLALCLTLLFKGSDWFGVPYGVGCFDYKVGHHSDTVWDVTTMAKSTNTTFNAFNPDQLLSCSSIELSCGTVDSDCLDKRFTHTYTDHSGASQNIEYSYSDLQGYSSECLECLDEDMRHNTIIFNAFIWCQIFNEFNSRKFEEMNMFEGFGGLVFPGVSLFTMGMQILIVQCGGEFVHTSPLDLNQWLITIALGACSLIVCVLSRIYPLKEDPDTFFSHAEVDGARTMASVEIIMDTKKDDGLVKTAAPLSID
jgi:magnesium-transporting ATPase (P-type)